MNDVMITPDSDIYLLKVPFEMDNENQLTFTDATAQYNYFMGLSDKLELENATYQRKDGMLRWAGSFDDIVEYNYCMYQNTHFSNKWFFAYIEDLKFENPSMTSIKLKTDVFQTWQFDIIYKNMFVEREHVNDDTVGLHTVPESLETGDYILNGSSTVTGLTFWNDIAYIVGVTKIQLLRNGSWQKSQAGLYFGTMSGLTYYGFLDNATERSDLISMLNYYDTEGQGESIECIFICPKEFVNAHRIANPLTAPYDQYRMEKVTTVLSNTFSLTRNSNVDGYTPRNNKLYVFPYQYLNVDNHGGTSYNYHYEDFKGINPMTGSFDFDVIGTLTVGCSIYMIPSGYRSTTNKVEYGLPFLKFPVCNWVSDVYTNWLTQTAVNIPIGIAQMGLGAGAMLISQGSVGGNYIKGGMQTIFDQLYQKYQHSFSPNESKGSMNSGDVLVSDLRFAPSFNQMTIKQEYAKIIDNYFTLYGYKINKVKIPNITGRTNWNYVKTINCNIVGDIPQKDIQELKGIFNNGVTLWHNPSTFLDYTQSNTIVT